MILQALNSYYQRLLADPELDVPQPGFADAKVSFALVLDQDGRLVDVHDLRIRKGKKLLYSLVRAPQAVTRTAGVAANFLWDKSEYVLGAGSEGVSQRSLEAFRAFGVLARETAGRLEDPGVAAVLKFLDSWQPEKAGEEVGRFQPWEEVAGANLVFRLDGEREYVHQSAPARTAWQEHYQAQESGPQGQCLVSGEIESLAPIHPKIKGVWGAQTSGAALVSFNLDAFTSYGKAQNYNAPIGGGAAFAYTTALNRLLAAGSRQRIQIGDASCVFWSEAKSELEEILGQVLDQSKAEDAEQSQRLSAFFAAHKNGQPFEHLNPQTPFYVLGLSPNASRLSVRFWHVSTVQGMEDRLGEHLQDIEVARGPREPEHPSLWMLLASLAPENKLDKLPPRLGGEMARALLSGGAYPKSILSAAVARIRADGFVNRSRAALIKAYLNRALHKDPTKAALYQSMEVTVSLDKESKNVPYRLGRLFAVLEDLQKSALGRNLNVTIRDRYMSSASSAPAATFPQLLRLAQAHIKKSDYGNKYQKDLAEVMEALPSSGFPASLKLEEQGLFFLGYYHQVKQIMDDIESAKAKKDQNAAGEALED